MVNTRYIRRFFGTEFYQHPATRQPEASVWLYRPQAATQTAPEQSQALAWNHPVPPRVAVTFAFGSPTTQRFVKPATCRRLFTGGQSFGAQCCSKHNISLSTTCNGRLKRPLLVSSPIWHGVQEMFRTLPFVAPGSTWWQTSHPIIARSLSTNG